MQQREIPSSATERAELLPQQAQQLVTAPQWQERRQQQLLLTLAVAQAFVASIGLLRNAALTHVFAALFV
jgi:hypothetical protein